MPSVAAAACDLPASALTTLASLKRGRLASHAVAAYVASLCEEIGAPKRGIVVATDEAIRGGRVDTTADECTAVGQRDADGAACARRASSILSPQTTTPDRAAPSGCAYVDSFQTNEPMAVEDLALVYMRLKLMTEVDATALVGSVVLLQRAVAMSSAHRHSNGRPCPRGGASPSLRVTPHTVHRLAMASVVVATKALSDVRCAFGSYAVAARVPVATLLELELIFFVLIGHDATVTAADFQATVSRIATAAADGGGTLRRGSAMSKARIAKRLGGHHWEEGSRDDEQEGNRGDRSHDTTNGDSHDETRNTTVVSPNAAPPSDGGVVPRPSAAPTAGQPSKGGCDDDEPAAMSKSASTVSLCAKCPPTVSTASAVSTASRYVGSEASESACSPTAHARRVVQSP